MGVDMMEIRKFTQFKLKEESISNERTYVKIND